MAKFHMSKSSANRKKNKHTMANKTQKAREDQSIKDQAKKNSQSQAALKQQKADDEFSSIRESAAGWRQRRAAKTHDQLTKRGKMPAMTSDDWDKLMDDKAEIGPKRAEGRIMSDYSDSEWKRAVQATKAKVDAKFANQAANLGPAVENNEEKARSMSDSMSRAIADAEARVNAKLADLAVHDETEASKVKSAMDTSVVAKKDITFKPNADKLNREMAEPEVNVDASKSAVEAEEGTTEAPKTQKLSSLQEMPNNTEAGAARSDDDESVHSERSSSRDAHDAATEAVNLDPQNVAKPAPKKLLYVGRHDEENEKKPRDANRAKVKGASDTPGMQAGRGSELPINSRIADYKVRIKADFDMMNSKISVSHIRCLRLLCDDIDSLCSSLSKRDSLIFIKPSYEEVSKSISKMYRSNQKAWHNRGWDSEDTLKKNVGKAEKWAKNCIYQLNDILSDLQKEMEAINGLSKTHRGPFSSFIVKLANKLGAIFNQVLSVFGNEEHASHYQNLAQNCSAKARIMDKMGHEAINEIRTTDNFKKAGIIYTDIGDALRSIEETMDFCSTSGSVKIKDRASARDADAPEASQQAANLEQSSSEPSDARAASGKNNANTK